MVLRCQLAPSSPPLLARDDNDHEYDSLISFQTSTNVFKNPTNVVRMPIAQIPRDLTTALVLIPDSDGMDMNAEV